ncbi:DUF4079 domain-containing protein [Leptolyngbya sp. NK1-12]|uniref:DUF4079 domain-containing protein n=1 Tax=Leptolyngbya sp. NK1-12 TaxID=2547451 RepID=A0AA96WEN8_9CYAN|nr:DUF4079 domain-containing protein [Leptolyngbya sp. NK1-12]MBF2046170.1 DUF4079 domain-containing protein [Elainella sp. C42_A2020_010]RNJ65520.1 MAG: DUF4079 domain-containing protein [Leptolyngbya sp. IPPAS B-1204]WNZ23195.1 DUF4079 domain-containing protein [Leptolyngbya sp. NK1-12]
MYPEDIAGLIHPALAVVFVFPLLGIVVNYAWQTRQRRLSAKEGGKSKIPASVGSEHLKLGRWLSNAVVGLTLIGLAHPIFTKMTKNQVWSQDSFRAWFIVLMFVATIASLVMLNRARTKLWRAVFATLTGMGLVILGSQPEVFRRGFEWYVSHYYYGITAAMLMIFSLAIIPDIYQDRTNRWRNVHVILNCLALLFFLGQGMTGTRDLLEIPLSWQASHIGKCDFANLTCPP